MSQSLAHKLTSFRTTTLHLVMTQNVVAERRKYSLRRSPSAENGPSHFCGVLLLPCHQVSLSRIVCLPSHPPSNMTHTVTKIALPTLTTNQPIFVCNVLSGFQLNQTSLKGGILSKHETICFDVPCQQNVRSGSSRTMT